MPEEQLDVNNTEETVVDPSTTNNTTVNASEGDITPSDNQEKGVPYERFKEVIDERNSYKELLAARGTKNNDSAEKQAENLSAETGQTYEDSLKLVKKLINEEVSGHLSKIENKMDLDRTSSKFPDFFQYSNQIKDKVKDNPHLTWEDAYKLAKFETGQMKATPAPKVATPTAETGRRAKSVNDTQSADVDVFAKGPDGKYLYSLDELKDILPHS
jgi:hypothetical protein